MLRDSRVCNVGDVVGHRGVSKCDREYLKLPILALAAGGDPGKQMETLVGKDQA